MWLTKTSDSTMVSFDPPENVAHTVPSDAALYGTWAGKTLQLKFNGFGNLQGGQQCGRLQHRRYTLCAGVFHLRRRHDGADQLQHLIGRPRSSVASFNDATGATTAACFGAPFFQSHHGTGNGIRPALATAPPPQSSDNRKAGTRFAATLSPA